MSLSRAVARPLLASIFISGGLDAVRHPETKVAAAQGVTDQLRTLVPSLPKDTASLVRFNGMVQLGRGCPPGDGPGASSGRTGPDRLRSPDDLCRPPILGGAGREDPGAATCAFLEEPGAVGWFDLGRRRHRGCAFSGVADEPERPTGVPHRGPGPSGHRCPCPQRLGEGRRGEPPRAPQGPKSRAAGQQGGPARGGAPLIACCSNAAASGLAVSGSSLRHVSDSAHHAAKAALGERRAQCPHGLCHIGRDGAPGRPQSQKGGAPRQWARCGGTSPAWPTWPRPGRRSPHRISAMPMRMPGRWPRPSAKAPNRRSPRCVKGRTRCSRPAWSGPDRCATRCTSTGPSKAGYARGIGVYRGGRSMSE